MTVNFDLLEFRPYRLFHLSRTWTETLDAYFSRAYGLSIVEVRVISVLGRLGESTASELSVFAHLDKIQMSRTLAKLRDKGMVQHMPHATDQRRQAIRMTAKGEEINRIVAELAAKLDQWLVAALPPKQLAQFDEALATLLVRIVQLPQALNAIASERSASAATARKPGAKQRASKNTRRK